MNAILINLMLAAFWLVLGVGLLAYEYVLQRGRLIPLPIGMNAGWVAIMLGAFNIYRVLMTRSRQRRLRESEDDDDALRRNFERHRAQRRREEQQRNEPPNPEFMFTDEKVKTDETAKKGLGPPDDRIHKSATDDPQ